MNYARNIGYRLLIFGFASNDENPLVGTQYLRPIFTWEVQFAFVHQVSRCAHIQWELHVMATFHLLDRTHLWLNTTDRQTTTSRKIAKIVNQHFISHHLPLNIGYCLSVLVLACNGKIILALGQYLWSVLYRETWRDGWEDSLRRNRSQICLFCWSLAEDCRRTRPSMKEGVFLPDEWESRTSNDNRHSLQGHTSRQLEKYLSQSKVEGILVGRKSYATVTSVTYCRMRTVLNELSPTASNAKYEHEF